VIDRKEAARRYKETPRPMGVFRVRDAAGRRSLLGTSVDLPSMLNRQRAQLDGGVHADRELQADWDSRGAGGFEFEILDTIEPLDEPGYDPADDLAALKDIWAERLVAEGEELYGPRTTR
jgi:hypothetical protein